MCDEQSTTATPAVGAPRADTSAGAVVASDAVVGDPAMMGETGGEEDAEMFEAKGGAVVQVHYHS